ncbi:polysaccharide pyruvyl transferase family protein [Arthrobacter sp. G.S.26]|uniref:polysaccharide pyruvyl transferase family protein n=1 Tax=Arthrobacter sp. G.S.26 TaxID=3433706 RepID=UPI003D781E10
MTKRVLVLWADNHSANLGVRVLAQGMAELARRAWGNSTIIDYQDYGPGESGVSFGTRSILRDIGRRNGPIKNRLRNYDVILHTGAGDSFADIYGLKRLSFMVYTHFVARRMQIPIVMGPQTIGPFTSAVGRLAARRMLRESRVVITRDTESASYSASLGRPVDALATDVVFALPLVETETTRDVVLNVSGLLWFGNEHVGFESYRASIRKLVALLEADGRVVSFLAHVVNRPSVVDDAAAIREFVAADALTNEVLIPESLAHVREYVGSAQLVIGSRMHACLNALSSGTPAIPWAYSRKFAPLLSDIGWDVSVDLKKTADPASTTMNLINTTTDCQWQANVQTVLTQAAGRLDIAVEALKADSPVAV